MNRELIYSKLWDAARKSVAAYTKSAERRLRFIEDVGPEQMPYLGMIQLRETARCDIPGVVTRWEGHVRLYLYAATERDVPPMIQLNPMIDALQQAFLPDTDQQDINLSNSTLGGLVTSVYIEGDILTAEGTLADREIVVVPVKLFLFDSP